VREADCKLCGTGTTGKIEREPAALGAHHQTGELDVALLAGGSGTGHRAQRAGMAEPVLPSDDAAGAEDGEGGDGAPTGDSFVLDVAARNELRGVG